MTLAFRSRSSRAPWYAVLACAGVLAAAPARSQAPVDVDPLHRPFDGLLDVYVRDGLVYYRALRSERAGLDAYLSALGSADVASRYEGWPPATQAAFWLNAYNAVVLRTVINHYPIQGSAPDYPSRSIRQIPGAFERTRHQVAGRSVTLDQIEQEILARFDDPRMFFAIGRGALGGGRLRSEAFASTRLEQQLEQVARECVTSRHCVEVDRTGQVVSASPVFGWREAAFVAAYGSKSPDFERRSPIERAILAFIAPNLLPFEREFIGRDAFEIRFQDFDWRLNDLTGGPPERR